MALRVRLSLHLLLLVLANTMRADATHWAYSGINGPNNWRVHYPTCGGFRQSPVNLRSTRALFSATLDPFIFTGFDSSEDTAWLLSNNGHTAQLTLKNGQLTVSGGRLNGEYAVVQFHFHWGSDDTRGSEHAVNGERFPMEMHIVTYKLIYNSVKNAMMYSDGLAVLGVFFELGQKDNKSFGDIVAALSSIREPGSSIPLETVPLQDLMPENTDRYFRYVGSLTTPPCNEAVVWTLFNDAVRISSRQLEAFRDLYSDEENVDGSLRPMENNFRPIQALYGRRIKVNFLF